MPSAPSSRIVHERARAIVDGPGENDDTIEANVLWGFGELRMAQKRYSDAVDLLQRAWELADPDIRPDIARDLEQARADRQ